MISGPTQRNGIWCWQAAAGNVRVLFAGRGGEEREGAEAELWRRGLEASGRPAGSSREEIFRRVTGEARSVAWAKQIHSARVLAARPGACGEGDALVLTAAATPVGSPITATTDPVAASVSAAVSAGAAAALCIVTADCVPVLLAAPGRLGAVHAGWRGIAQGIVGAAVAALGAPAAGVTAWIGPAIGPCCYQVGAEVADEVSLASDRSIVTKGPGGRPHLDLQAAVRFQLEREGVHDVAAVGACTFCRARELHSYRRENQAPGRNHAFVWIDG